MELNNFAVLLISSYSRSSYRAGLCCSMWSHLLSCWMICCFSLPSPEAQAWLLEIVRWRFLERGQGIFTPEDQRHSWTLERCSFLPGLLAPIWPKSLENLAHLSLGFPHQDRCRPSPAGVCVCVCVCVICTHWALLTSAVLTWTLWNWASSLFSRPHWEKSHQFYRVLEASPEFILMLLISSSSFGQELEIHWK